MRTYLKTSFAEKDEVKALGARWDPARKAWYVQDVKDLAPFQRWLVGGVGAASAPSAAPPRTGPAQVAPHCGCDVLPWDACVHTPPGH